MASDSLDAVADSDEEGSGDVRRRWEEERKRGQGDQRRKGNNETGAVNYNKVQLATCIGCIKILIRPCIKVSVLTFPLHSISPG